MKKCLFVALALLGITSADAGLTSLFDKAKEKASAAKQKVQDKGRQALGTTTSILRQDLDLLRDVAQGRKGVLKAARQSTEIKLQATKDFFNNPPKPKFLVVPDPKPAVTISVEPPLSEATYKEKQSAAYYFMGSVMQPGAPLVKDAQEALFDDTKHEAFVKKVIVHYQKELAAHKLPTGSAAIPLLKEAMVWIAEGPPSEADVN